MNLNKKSALCSRLISAVHTKNPICVWLGFHQIAQIQHARLCVFNCLQHLETLRKRLKVAPEQTSSNKDPQRPRSIGSGDQWKVIIPRQAQPLRVQESSPKKRIFCLFVCCSRSIAEPETSDLKGEEKKG